MPKKPKKLYPKCFGCKEERDIAEVSAMVKILKGLNDKWYKVLQLTEKDAYQSLINSNFEWACDYCIKKRKAIVANPSLQNHYEVHLAYTDKALVCGQCKEEFTFTKEEKQIWFEKYKLHYCPSPSNCLKCRRNIRQLKAETKLLSQIFKKDTLTVSAEEWQTVIDIYTKWEKPEKVKYYQSMLRKKTKQQS